MFRYGSIPIHARTSEHVWGSRVAEVRYHWHLDQRYEYNHVKSLYLTWKDNHCMTQWASLMIIQLMQLINFSFFHSVLKRFPLIKSGPRTTNWYFSFSISYKKMCIIFLNVYHCHTLITSLLIVLASSAIALSPRLVALSWCWSPNFLSSTIMNVTLSSFS